MLKPIIEAAGVSTNDAAQSSLTTIEILELCQDQLPTAVPTLGRPPGGGRRGGAGTPPANANSKKE